MTMRPDPTFHASPKLAMEAPPENFAYTLLLSPDFSKPDALAVIDVKRGSPTFSQIVHTGAVTPSQYAAATGFTTSSRCRLRADWRSHRPGLAALVYAGLRHSARAIAWRAPFAAWLSARAGPSERKLIAGAPLGRAAERERR